VTQVSRRRWLFSLLTVSVGLIILGQILSLSPLIGVALSCAPLLYYHVVVLWWRTNGELTSTEIDSVYYFGFLITIFSLAAGVYSFKSANANAGQEDTLLSQFAVGIVATAYAVFARMHLAGRSDGISVGDPQERLAELVYRNDELITKLSVAGHVADELARNLSSARDQIPRQTATELAAALTDIRREFNAGLADSLSSLAASTAQINDSLSKSAELTGKNGIVPALNEVVHSMQSLAKGTSSAADASLELATAMSMTGNDVVSLRGVVSSSRVEFEALRGVGDTLRSFDAAASASAAAVGEAATELVRVANDLRGVGDAVSTAPRTMKRLADQVVRTSEGMDYLAEVAAKIAAAADGLSRASESTQSLTIGVERVIQVTPKLAESLEAVQRGSVEASRQLESLTATIGGTESAMRKVEQSTATLDGANADLRSLAASAKELSSTLSAVVLQISTVEKDLLSASSLVRETTKESTAALKEDLDAATKSAIVVSGRLVTLVNTIITETNRQPSRQP